MGEIVADISEGGLRVTLRAAEPLMLHPPDFPRTDANSPVRVDAEGAVAFFSHYVPRGHSYHRRFGSGLRDGAAPQAVRLLDDPDPNVGKWIEAVWRDPRGPIYGWYHAEEILEGPPPLFVPHIGAVVSSDDGMSWRCLGEVLRAPAGMTDSGYRNGFLAGGYGDFCVVPDCGGQYFYLAFSCYVTDEAAQGIAMARFPIAMRDNPAPALELWCAGEWRPATGQLPTPLWPTRRGWRHTDPDAFWGPAIHFNRQLDAYVMLLNHTAGGHYNMLQEGVYVSVSRTPENPSTWTRPMRLVAGGAWYPQVVGLTAGGGDTLVDGPARFFMAGYSAWDIEFAWTASPEHRSKVLEATKPLFYSLFGDRHKAPW
ncbi:hypothetical protein [Ferrovibrio sp.]|uniref:hypothetical protein n=1 Tax=Ferrovibrio sp. TaxID=1917215 RepID=UPI0026363D2C|nr:hypothetical protein [Ferrovibrio sp.]